MKRLTIGDSILLPYLFVLTVALLRLETSHPLNFVPVFTSLLFFGACRPAREFAMPLLGLVGVDIFLTMHRYGFALTSGHAVTWIWYLGAMFLGGAMLGLGRAIGETIAGNRVDEVIVVDPDFPERELLELVDRAHERGVRVRIAPSTTGILVHRAEFVPGQSVPLFELRAPVFEGIDFVLKRSFDLVVSTLLVIVFSPLLLAIAVAIKLESRGPMLYRSMRPGIGGVPFACLKFRTMILDAEGRQCDLEEHNEASGALFKMRSDPRRTRVGRALRRFSLDELPQLVNVLRGQMSLVGPRPLPQRDFDRLEEWHLQRYQVMPGMTGLWQVSGRAELDFDDLVRLDFLYLERWSVFLDLTILVKTLPAVIWGRGAY